MILVLKRITDCCYQKNPSQCSEMFTKLPPSWRKTLLFQNLTILLLLNILLIGETDGNNNGSLSIDKDGGEGWEESEIGGEEEEETGMMTIHMINVTETYHRFYLHPVVAGRTFAIVAEAAAAGAGPRPPLELQVCQQRSIINQLRIPANHFQHSNSLKLTLCPPELPPTTAAADGGTTEHVDVVLPQRSEQREQVSIRLEPVQYDVTVGETVSPIEVSPTSPAMFRFELKDRDSSYLLTIQNQTEAVCTLGKI